jgi:hypothetical protein
MSVMGGAFSRRYSSLSQELPDWSRYLPFTELAEPGFGAVGYGEVRPVSALHGLLTNDKFMLISATHMIYIQRSL